MLVLKYCMNHVTFCHNMAQRKCCVLFAHDNGTYLLYQILFWMILSVTVQRPLTVCAVPCPKRSLRLLGGQCSSRLEKFNMCLDMPGPPDRENIQLFSHKQAAPVYTCQNHIFWHGRNGAENPWNMYGIWGIGLFPFLKNLL